MAQRVYVDNELDFEPADPFPWMEVAACHGMDTTRWFSKVPEVRDEAKKICNTKCSKRLECLVYILARESPGYRREGIFGGMEPSEREDIAVSMGLVKKKTTEEKEEANG